MHRKRQRAAKCVSVKFVIWVWVFVWRQHFGLTKTLDQILKVLCRGTNSSNQERARSFTIMAWNRPRARLWLRARRWLRFWFQLLVAWFRVVCLTIQCDHSGSHRSRQPPADSALIENSDGRCLIQSESWNISVDMSTARRDLTAVTCNLLKQWNFEMKSLQWISKVNWQIQMCVSQVLTNKHWQV